MRIYKMDEVCRFRFTRQAWGAFSNFQPLAVPIAAGPWTFATSGTRLPGGQVRRRPRRAAADCERPDGARSRRHRAQPEPRHGPALDRPAGERDALGCCA